MSQLPPTPSRSGSDALRIAKLDAGLAEMEINDTARERRAQVVAARKAAVVGWLKAFAFEHEERIAAEASAKGKMRAHGYNYPQVRRNEVVQRWYSQGGRSGKINFKFYYFNLELELELELSMLKNGTSRTRMLQTYEEIRVAADRVAAAQASLKQFRRLGLDFV